MDRDTKTIITIGIVLLVVGITYVALTAYGVVDINLKWNKHAMSAYHEAREEIGAPSTLYEGRKGLAKWDVTKLNDAGYPIYKLMIKNEEVQHCCPTPHVDMVTAGVKVNVYDSAMMLAILGTSKSFWYDQGRNMLYARCCCLGTVLAHLVFASNILLRSKDLVIQQYAQPTLRTTLVQELNGLFNSVYIPWSSNDMNTYERARSDLKKKLIENLSKLKYTEMSECPSGSDCTNTLGFMNLTNDISGTPICSKNVTTTLIPQTEGMSGYYTQGVPSDGKMYNLGLPREFNGCGPMPSIVAMGAPKVNIIKGSTF
jgi:hypothetical protein